MNKKYSCQTNTKEMKYQEKQVARRRGANQKLHSIATCLGLKENPTCQTNRRTHTSGLKTSLLQGHKAFEHISTNKCLHELPNKSLVASICGIDLLQFT